MQAFMARMAATALRSMQGICTRPQMGSQVRPRLCSMAISAAYSTWSRVRPYNSARAAAALAELYGQDLDQVEYAAEVAMEHHLGLTCDPICGLVQIPCIERNAVAAMRAMNACNLSYFLTGSRNISYDMVCRAMHETGINLNQRFRETSEGGLAKLYDRKSRK